MKNIIKKTTLLMAMTMSTAVIAETANNMDSNACKILICTQQEAFQQPKVTEKCIEAQEYFFQIIYKKRGKISIPKTVEKRYNKLKLCEGARDSDIRRVIEIWGHVIDPRGLI